MKFIYSVICSVLLTSNIQSQTLSDFFKYEGVQSIAYMAHPFGGYESGSYTIYDDYVFVEINYSSGHTKLKLNKYGNVFTSIQVVEDNFFWAPFSAVETIKNVAFAEIDQSYSEDLVGKFEAFFDKSLYAMSGKELGCIMLTFSWLDY